MSRERVLTLVAVGVTLLAWASAFVVIRGVAPHLGGGALALGRLAVGTLALGIVALVQRRWTRPTAREWVQIVVYGVAWFGAYNVALNISEHTLDAGTSAMLVGIGPILIALGGGAFLGEGVPRWLLIGTGVAFCGVVLIGLGTSLSARAGHPVDVVGVLWALVAAVTYAIGVLVQKPAIRRLPAGQVTFLGCAIGLVACLPFAGQLAHELSRASVAADLGILYLGIVPTGIGFSTWAYALQRMPAGRLGISTYVVPVITIVLALVVFGELPTWLAIAGGVLALAGVALSRRRSADGRVPVPASVENLPE
ncbi:DMT family transporter [Pseudolysinimonas kribbensis]|uniref:DMT family transporter n=1 Tax=Pseudolysinimonas kribbensis TaxID=433641 RepID=UPI0031D08C29